ncbi:MAG: peptide-methionine (S)-S-oxide reductase MsrA [Bacteroidales bacterium]|nr:peptide-methionine (S)-S-oxide reductase MsrA [Bacteroidales bacterium]
MQTKEGRYAALLPVVRSLMNDEGDEIARMANLAALLHHEFGFWWTGFYRVSEADDLALGSFQGPPAGTRIQPGKGVCGTAWAEDRTVVVPDVSKFRGHIACSSESKSEIVVPLRSHGQVVAVLDIDSRELGAFDRTDALWLEKIAAGVYGPQRDIWFAAGCFWGAQKFLKMVPGVEFTEVGFANGRERNPTYEQVYTDTTGHAECVHVRYNPEVISLKELVRLYFRIIDPLSLNRQGEDEGTRYRTGVYYEDERDFDILSKEFFKMEKKLGCKLAVELQHIICFYRADEYHQDYLDKNPGGYCHLSPELFKLAAEYKKK